jgi:hypothetical protein
MVLLKARSVLQEDLMQHFHPWRVQAKIFDFVKVTEGAQQPKQSIIRWIASLRSQ